MSKGSNLKKDAMRLCLRCMQALAQYLVNLNVWTHNVLTIIARRKALQSSSACNVRCAGNAHTKP